LLNGGFSVKNRCCKFGEGGECRFTLWRSPCFSVRSMGGAIPKAGNELCGDSHRVIVSDDGYTAAILSDGMGAGEEAAKLSKMTISLLERLMAAGLDKKVSLQLVNSILLLRSADENFATLDLFVLDHYTGEGEFIKIGSAPTYLKRGKDIDVIRSTSLPVGILHNVEPEYFRYSLQDEDYVILITDGFLGFNEDKGGDWILKALKKADNIGAEALCRYLLELARVEAGSTIEDDMSIIVLQIINEDNSTKTRNSLI
jgi:stage II sporulation protein E